MKDLKVILVDDELSALELLKFKLSTLFPQLNIIGAYQKPEQALKEIRIKQPDIVFLDIEMPRMNGFELLSDLGSIEFEVIFVTAYNEYALKAIKQSAVDYVLKPVSDEEISLSVNKAVEAIQQKERSENNMKLVQVLQDTLNKTNKLIVPTVKGLSFIPQAEVLHLEGDAGYTRIHLCDGSDILSSYSLGKFEGMLSGTFFKCHKSHIINLEKVRSFENEGYIVLENTNRIPISRTQRKAFLDLFKN